MAKVYFCSIETEDIIIQETGEINTEFSVAYYKSKDEVDIITEVVPIEEYKETLLDLCIKYVKESPIASGVSIMINAPDAMYHLQDIYNLSAEIATMNIEDPMNRIHVAVTFSKFEEGSKGVIN